MLSTIILYIGYSYDLVTAIGWLPPLLFEPLAYMFLAMVLSLFFVKGFLNFLLAIIFWFYFGFPIYMYLRYGRIGYYLFFAFSTIFISLSFCLRYAA